MAKFGAMYPCFAAFDGEETATSLPTYSNGVVLGELVNANLTVTNASGEIWGDNKKIENMSEFAAGSIPMETVDMLDETAAVVYGTTVTDQEVHWKANDVAPYGGLTYIQNLKRGGKTFFRGCFYPKAQAAVGNDNAQTKSSSITFQTTTTNFSIMAPLFDDGAWRITKTFDTLAEAQEWTNTKLNIPTTPAGG